MENVGSQTIIPLLIVGRDVVSIELLDLDRLLWPLDDVDSFNTKVWTLLEY